MYVNGDAKTTQALTAFKKRMFGYVDANIQTLMIILYHLFSCSYYFNVDLLLKTV